MKERYLEVTYRRGMPIAGYLHLPRPNGVKSARTEEVAPGLLVDFSADGTPSLFCRVTGCGYDHDNDTIRNRRQEGVRDWSVREGGREASRGGSRLSALRPAG